MSIIPKEKTFRFTKAMRPDGSAITEDVRESQLTPQQIQVIYGDLLRQFNEAPKKVKKMFVNRITSQIVNTQRGRLMKDLSDRIEEHGKKLKRKESSDDSTEQKEETKKTS